MRDVFKKYNYAGGGLVSHSVCCKSNVVCVEMIVFFCYLAIFAKEKSVNRV